MAATAMATMAPLERLPFRQELKWIDLHGCKQERTFLEDKARNIKHRDYLGPIMRRRMEWLNIRLKADTSDPIVRLTQNADNSPGSPVPRHSPRLGRSSRLSGGSASSRQSQAQPKKTTPMPRLVSSQTPRASLEPFARRKDCASPYKRGWVGNNAKTMNSQPREALRPLKAETLEESFLQDLPDRLSRSLMQLELPMDNDQKKAIEALHTELRKAIRAVSATGYGCRDELAGLSGIAQSYARFLLCARDKDQNEAALTATWCHFSNHAWAFLREFLFYSLSQAQSRLRSRRGFSAESIACPGDDEPVLFHNTSDRNTQLDSETTVDVTRPDIQGLRDAGVRTSQGGGSSRAVQWYSSDDPSHLVALTSQEVKFDANQDLGAEVAGQTLRNMYKCFQHQGGLIRTFHLTVTNSRIRLWMGDASSTSTSRAYDAFDDSDALDIAQILALMCSKEDQLAPALKPLPGMVLHCDYPEVKDVNGRLVCPSEKSRRYFRIVGEVRFMRPPDTRLWGRHTACWSAQAEEVELSAIDGTFVRVANSPERIPLVLKAGWLPAYLRLHEYEMLRILHRGDDEYAPLAHEDEFPWALGVVDLSQLPNAPEPTYTARLPHIPRSGANMLEVSQQTTLVLLAQMCQVGFCVLDTAPAPSHQWTVPQLLRILRDLLRLLKRVSQKGIHYRDINLGNFALKPNFENLLLSQPESSILLLFDFGNSRYLDEHRGGNDDPRATGLELGVDDALSVNANFLSHRTLLCMHHLEVAVQHVADQLPCLAADMFKEAQKLEHRFVDDCESAIWAFLRLLQAWFAEQTVTKLEALFFQVDDAVNRSFVWRTMWRNSISGISVALPQDDRAVLLKVMLELNQIIWNCQEQLHTPTLLDRLQAIWWGQGAWGDFKLLRGKVSRSEENCFDRCDDALNASLRSASTRASALNDPVSFTDDEMA